MNILLYLTQDWYANQGYTKGKLLTASFRLAAVAGRNKFLRVLLLPYLGFYKFWVEWVLGIEIPYQTKIAPGLKVYHGIALIINRHTVIGKDCLLRHSTTIGNTGNEDLSHCPIIGDNVNIGAHVCILGKIKVGDNAVIGAGSVVTKDVPPNAVVVGNPARVIRMLSQNPEATSNVGLVSASV